MNLIRFAYLGALGAAVAGAAAGVGAPAAAITLTHAWELNGSTDAFTMWLAGAWVGTLVNNAASSFSGDGAPVWIAQDDYATAGSENSAGFLDYLRFYSGAATSDDAAALYAARDTPLGGPSAVPLPAAAPLLAAGLAGLGLLARRKSRAA